MSPDDALGHLLVGALSLSFQMNGSPHKAHPLAPRPPVPSTLIPRPAEHVPALSSYQLSSFLCLEPDHSKWQENLSPPDLCLHPANCPSRNRHGGQKAKAGADLCQWAGPLLPHSASGQGGDGAEWGARSGLCSQKLGFNLGEPWARFITVLTQFPHL